MTSADTPLLLIYFNRPQVLEQNLRALAGIRPRRLFVASDGARQGVAEDRHLVEQCHQVVRDCADWDCEVLSLHAQVNHGCDAWVPKAITWFFDNVDEGIILEDDCLIDTSFYTFATELLSRYRDRKQVMGISGSNFQSQRWGDGDYYLSRYPQSAGWATWARAWQRFDPTLGELDAILSTRLSGLVSSAAERRFWTRFFKGLKSGRYPFWDGKWVYSIWNAGGLVVAPNFNMVTNIGFGPDATHTGERDEALAAKIETIPSDLRAPSAGHEVFPEADRHWFWTRVRPTFSGRFRVLRRRLLGGIKSMLWHA